MNFEWVGDSIYKGNEYINSIYYDFGVYFFYNDETLVYFDNSEDCKKELLIYIKNKLGIVDYVEIGREEGLVLYEF